jgi:hypothetical protein
VTEEELAAPSVRHRGGIERAARVKIPPTLKKTTFSAIAAVEHFPPLSRKDVTYDRPKGRFAYVVRPSKPKPRE